MQCSASRLSKLPSCHDKSWYQLKHGLQVWAIKVVFNVSSLSTREGIDGSSNAQEEMVLRQVWENSEFVTRGPSKLAKQPNNHKTVVHIINPGKITQFVHATDLAWHSPGEERRGSRLECVWYSICQCVKQVGFEKQQRKRERENQENCSL